MMAEPGDTRTFLLERAQAEHSAAERKRDATVTKATAIATFSAALIAIIAAPTFDTASVGDRTGRWLLLGAVIVLSLAILSAGGALSVSVSGGERVSRRELDNWNTLEFQQADLSKHTSDFTAMFVKAATNLRDANERAEAWLSWAARAVGAGVVVLVVVFAVEIA